ncbi:hypothetical protein FJZ26_01085 [Candidatus Parvarchaeota archaeon]|nr:hypothetical protein [Candidatus Parvarchaeota archaeon]
MKNEFGLIKTILLFSVLVLLIAQPILLAQGSQGGGNSVSGQSAQGNAVGKATAPGMMVPYETLDLYPGWNLISSPVYDPAAMKVGTSCQIIGSYYHYDTKSKKYIESSDPSSKDGYWVYSKNACTLYFYPSYNTDAANAYPLYPGWNQVGQPFLSLGNRVDISQVSGDCSISKGPYSYNSKSNTYEKTSYLQKGRGLWIYADDKCSLRQYVEPPQPPTPAPLPADEVSLDLSGKEPRFSSNGKVKLVEFSDFECPFCARASSTLYDLSKKYDQTLSFYFMNFPLSFHPNAQMAAEASECADEQGRFWNYHDKLFTNQQSLDIASLKRYASDLGMDTENFKYCLDDRRATQAVANDQSQGMLIGVSGTPSFVIYTGDTSKDMYAKLKDVEAKYSTYGMKVVKVKETDGRSGRATGTFGYGVFFAGALPYDVFDEIVRVEIGQTPVPAKMADLAVSEIKFEQLQTARTDGKQLVNAAVVVANKGSAASDIYDMDIYVDGVLALPTYRNDKLEAGATGYPTGSSGFQSAQTPGSHTYKIVIKPYGSDANAANNEYSKEFYVKSSSIDCTDSDNGLDYSTRGRGTGIYSGGSPDSPVIYGQEPNPSTAKPSPYAYSVYYDYCATGTQLNEAFCKDGKLEAMGYNCPYGCSNGVCKSAPQTVCTDTDGGVNYYTKGTTSGIDGNRVPATDTDSCIDSTNLIEWFCSGSYRTNTNYACPSGYTCSNGACVQSGSDPADSLASRGVIDVGTGLDVGEFQVRLKDLIAGRDFQTNFARLEVIRNGAVASTNDQAPKTYFIYTSPSTYSKYVVYVEEVGMGSALNAKWANARVYKVNGNVDSDSTRKALDDNAIPADGGSNDVQVSSGVIDIGQVLDFGVGKARLDDLGVSQYSESPAMVSILDANSATLKRVNIGTNSYRTVSINGQTYAIYAIEVAPGFTMNAKWARLAIYQVSGNPDKWGIAAAAKESRPQSGATVSYSGNLRVGQSTDIQSNGVSKIKIGVDDITRYPSNSKAAAISIMDTAGNVIDRRVVLPGFGTYYSTAGNDRFVIFVESVNPDPTLSNVNAGITVYALNTVTANRPPVINGVGGDAILVASQAGTWRVRASDPDGNSLFYAVLWGDETGTANNFKNLVRATFSGSEFSSQHTYYAPGTYTIQFNVSDSQGASTIATYTVTVNPQPVPTTCVNMPPESNVAEVNVNLSVGETLPDGNYLIKVKSATSTSASFGILNATTNNEVAGWDINTNYEGSYLTPEGRMIKVKLLQSGNGNVYVKIRVSTINYPIINAGEQVCLDGYKMRLSDVIGDVRQRYAIVDVIDPNNQILNQAQIAQYATYTRTVPGKIMKISIREAVPGFIMNAKWAQIYPYWGVG